VFVNPRLAKHHEIQSNSGTGEMGEGRLTEAQRTRVHRELRKISQFRQTGNFMEIGPGMSAFLPETRLFGFEPYAVEINEAAAAFQRECGISHIVTQPVEELSAHLPEMDVVRMWDVIEHLKAPSRAIAAAWALLRSGGLITLATTNFDSLSRWWNGPEWVYLNGADHIYLFTPATLTALLVKHGFADVRIRTRSFNLRRKLYYPPREPVSRFSALTPFRKIIDELIRFSPYGHQMIATAVKP
jgi:hypothetical protein